VNLLIGYSSPLLALGFLGTFSYAVRELIAELAIFSVGFAVLFLVAVAFLLYHHPGPGWMHERAPRWGRAGRDWIVELFRNEQTPVLVAVIVQLPPVKQLSCTLALARMPE
jgi:hypothetical protein